MSERTWKDMHADPYPAKDWLISGGKEMDKITRFSRGGVNEFLPDRPEESNHY